MGAAAAAEGVDAGMVLLVLCLFATAALGVCHACYFRAYLSHEYLRDGNEGDEESAKVGHGADDEEGDGRGASLRQNGGMELVRRRSSSAEGVDAEDDLAVI